MHGLVNVKFFNFHTKWKIFVNENKLSAKFCGINKMSEIWQSACLDR